MSDESETKDCNGNTLNDGDAIRTIKDLKVKGTSVTLKPSKTIKNIRLTNDPDQIEVKEGKSWFVLKTCFVKKVNK